VDTGEDSGSGWQSIQDALTALHGEREPHHFGTLHRYAEGGADPLDGVSAYAVDQPGHWHFVSFGLSELYDMQSDDAGVSGWGFELTFRLIRGEDEQDCPTWPVRFLQTLARYVFNTGAVFDDGHYIPMGGPITESGPPAMTGLVFAEDPQLAKLLTVNGTVKFIQAVCVTHDELGWVERHGAEDFIELYARRDPLLVSDLHRQPFIDTAT
jgi:suppressor of fused